MLLNFVLIGSDLGFGWVDIIFDFLALIVIQIFGSTWLIPAKVKRDWLYC